MSVDAGLTQHKVTVLLIDDQPIIGEAVRRMLAGEGDIVFHHCKDATKALEEAARVSPTVILQDLVMPEIDGLTLVKLFRENASTREIPMIVLSTKEDPKVKSDAFALGANDYIVKFPDKLELLARIRHHSKGYINLLQRNEAFRALVASQKVLANDLAQANKYVRSLLPDPLRKGPVRTEWRFIPSASLGGVMPNHFSNVAFQASGRSLGASESIFGSLRVTGSNAAPRKPADWPLCGGESVARKNHPRRQHAGLALELVEDRPQRRVVLAGDEDVVGPRRWPPQQGMGDPDVVVGAPVMHRADQRQLVRMLRDPGEQLREVDSRY